ncbi:MAG: hypothetical protein U0R64_01170 [Candidatus Nanopelagicales bacterium]
MQDVATHAPGAGTGHVLYLAIGFPPAAKSCAYRMRATACAFVERGWSVTAVSLADESWEREMGLDPSLLTGLPRAVERVGLPLARYDMANDIRGFSRDQALHHEDWLAEQEALDRATFPEAIFGRWLDPLQRALTDEHRRRPADLVLVSPAPYVGVGAASRFCADHDVPLAIDYRDAWSLDVISGDEAFTRDSAEGRWETEALGRATQVWFVNDAIRGFYQQRYPEFADRMITVPNGFDQDPGNQVVARAHQPLRFGYLGTITLSVEQLTTVLRGWRLARDASPLLAGATLEFRGHVATGNVGAGRRQRAIERFADDGVSYGGPVLREDVAEVYGGWDGLVLALVGSEYVTSGKVYEYAATGLPIVSAHDPRSAAAAVLADYPRWFPNRSLTPPDIAAAFIAAAENAGADPGPARQAAQRFDRARITADAVAGLTRLVVREGTP